MFLYNKSEGGMFMLNEKESKVLNAIVKYIDEIRRKRIYRKKRE